MGPFFQPVMPSFLGVVPTGNRLSWTLKSFFFLCRGPDLLVGCGNLRSAEQILISASRTFGDGMSRLKNRFTSLFFFWGGSKPAGSLSFKMKHVEIR